MTRKLLQITLCLVSIMSFAQEKIINELNGFKVRNSGAFIDENNDVDGYFVYYDGAKKKKGTTEYAIKIMDNDLNEVAVKSFVDDKGSFVTQGKFNNQALAFSVVNFRKSEYKVVTYDKKGDRGDDVSIKVSKSTIMYLNQMLQMNLTKYDPLTPIDNKGFLFTYSEFEKGQLFSSIKYVPTDGGKSWEYKQGKNKKTLKALYVIDANEKYVFIGYSETVFSKRKASDDKSGYILIDTTTGEVLFDKEIGEDNASITNVFYDTDGNVVTAGLYFDEDFGKTTYKDYKSNGFAIKVLDIKGNELSSKFLNWESDFAKFNIKNNTASRALAIHEIVRTNNGHYHMIAEEIRKSDGKKEELVVGDILTLEFDENFDIVDAKNFEKPNYVHKNWLAAKGMSTEMAGGFLSYIGQMDHQYTQIDTERDRFYSVFKTRDVIDKKTTNYGIKVLIQNEGTISVDDVPLESNSKDINYFTLPGKLGKFVLLEYNKKTKQLRMSLESFNVE